MTAPIDLNGLLEAVRLRMGVSTDIWLLGWERKTENRAPPLFVWWADRTRDLPIEAIGGLYVPVATTALGFIVKIWGADLNQCFALYTQLRTALHLEADTSVMIGDGRFARPGKVTLGMGLEVPVLFKVPVPNTLVDIGVVQATQAILTTTDAVSSDGWLELGD